jgi:hypothetical protein
MRTSDLDDMRRSSCFPVPSGRHPWTRSPAQWRRPFRSLTRSEPGGDAGELDSAELDPAAFHEAARLLTEAVALTPADSPDSALYLYNLGESQGQPVVLELRDLYPDDVWAAYLHAGV